MTIRQELLIAIEKAENTISIHNTLPLQQLEELLITVERAIEKIESDQPELIKSLTNVNREPDNS